MRKFIFIDRWCYTMPDYVPAEDGNIILISKKLKITIPAGSTESFVYSDEEISPTGNKITISSGEGLGDTEVVLKTVKVKEKNAYEPTYLTPGMPVEMDVEKGAWFKVGVSMQNDTDADITVYVEVEGIEVRIE